MKRKVLVPTQLFKITDELKDVLEFVGTATATVDGRNQPVITVSGKTLASTLNEQELKDYQTSSRRGKLRLLTGLGVSLKSFQLNSSNDILRKETGVANKLNFIKAV